MENNAPIPKVQPTRFKKTTPKRVIVYVIDKTLANPRQSSASLATEIEIQLNFEISASTVNRIRHDQRFTRKAPRYVQKLSHDQKDARVAFCYTLLGAGIPLNKLVFSDESRFVFHDDSGLLWRRYGDDNEAAQVGKVKFDQGLLVYAAIGVGYKSKLVIIDTTVDHFQYWLNLQASGMFDLDPESYIFVQDGATCHTAKRTMEFLETRCNTMKWWPANSPDLNPIEHLWAIMKRIVRTYLQHWAENGNPLTKPILAQMIQSAWESISQEMIDDLVNTFEQRVITCASRNGASLNGHFHEKVAQATLPPCPVPQLQRTVNQTVQFIDRTKPQIEIPPGIEVLPIDRPKAKTGPWTAREIEDLIRLQAVYQSQWKNIAPRVGRSEAACRKKFETLAANLPQQPPPPVAAPQQPPPPVAAPQQPPPPVAAPQQPPPPVAAPQQPPPPVVFPQQPPPPVVFPQQPPPPVTAPQQTASQESESPQQPFVWRRPAEPYIGWRVPENSGWTESPLATQEPSPPLVVATPFCDLHMNSECSGVFPRSSAERRARYEQPSPAPYSSSSGGSDQLIHILFGFMPYEEREKMAKFVREQHRMVGVPPPLPPSFFQAPLEEEEEEPYPYLTF